MPKVRNLNSTLTKKQSLSTLTWVSIAQLGFKIGKGNNLDQKFKKKIQNTHYTENVRIYRRKGNPKA